MPAGSAMPPAPPPATVLEAIQAESVVSADVALAVMEEREEDSADERDEDAGELADDDVDEVALRDDNAEDEDGMDVVELLNPDTVGKAPTLERLAAGVDSGAAGLPAVSTAPAVGTPDGHGYAGTDGTCKSVGNAGTAGTEGKTTACEVDTTAGGIKEVSPTTGVAVACPTTFPEESSVATTSTFTVSTWGVTCAERR